MGGWGVRKELKKEKQTLFGSGGGREIPFGILGNWTVGVRNVLGAPSPPYHLQQGFWSRSGLESQHSHC